MPLFARRRPAAGAPAESVAPAVSGVPAEPSPRSWDRPIVVDEPVAAFEPRPPDGPHPPDTVCDAWSTEHFTVRAAAVRGYEHRYRGLPRQDDLAVRVHRPTQAVVFAVA